jgi:hypothetical protein
MRHERSLIKTLYALFEEYRIQEELIRSESNVSLGELEGGRSPLEVSLNIRVDIK